MRSSMKGGRPSEYKIMLQAAAHFGEAGTSSGRKTRVAIQKTFYWPEFWPENRPCVKLKRSYVQTARIGTAFTQRGTFFSNRIWVPIQ